MTYDDPFERWCLVDDGSTFEEWLELDEMRRESERLNRELWAKMAPLMQNAAQSPAQLAAMAMGQQNTLAFAMGNPLAQSGIGGAFGAILGSVFQ